MWTSGYLWSSRNVWGWVLKNDLLLKGSISALKVKNYSFLRMLALTICSIVSLESQQYQSFSCTLHSGHSRLLGFQPAKVLRLPTFWRFTSTAAYLPSTSSVVNYLQLSEMHFQGLMHYHMLFSVWNALTICLVISASVKTQLKPQPSVNRLLLLLKEFIALAYMLSPYIILIHYCTNFNLF